MQPTLPIRYQLTFAAETELEERAELESAIAAVRTPRRSPAKPNHELARRRIEVAGERALESPDEPAASRRAKWYVRIYYRSAGDELLCFDAGPFVRAVADRVKSEHTAPQVYVEPTGRRHKDAPMYVDAAGWAPSAEVLAGRTARVPIGTPDVTSTPKLGALLVVLPSQLEQRADEDPCRPCPECGSDELCRPECVVAPWNLTDDKQT